MADLMTFPDTVEEFMEKYKVTDTEHVYTNGTEFVPIFRMKQWFEHAADVAPVRHGRWGKDNDCSECGCQPWFERDIHTLSYCPNCGAKMDKGEGDGN